MLVEAVAALRVVYRLPWGAPNGQFDALHIEGLGEVLESQVETRIGFAHFGSEDDRDAEGGETDRGGLAERRDEVEDAEVAGRTATVAGLNSDHADLGRVRAALA
jgi:hypothetical protein